MGRMQECLYQTCFSLKGGSRVVSWLGWGVPSWAVHPLGALSAPDGEQVWNKSTTKPWEPCYKFQACKMSAQRLAWDITLPVCVHLTGSFYIYLFISPDLEWNCGLGQKKKKERYICEMLSHGSFAADHVYHGKHCSELCRQLTACI